MGKRFSSWHKGPLDPTAPAKTTKVRNIKSVIMALLSKVPLEDMLLLAAPPESAHGSPRRGYVGTALFGDTRTEAE